MVGDLRELPQGPRFPRLRELAALMDEIIHIDQRPTSVIHETDRARFDLLAKTYQQITDNQPRLIPGCGSVHHGVHISAKAVLTQEAQS